jgi:hypothetical protein
MASIASSTRPAPNHELLVVIQRAIKAEECACLARSEFAAVPKRSTPMFHFARALKASPLFANLEAEEVVSRVRRYVDMKKIFEEFPFGDEYRDPEMQLAFAWNVVRFPAGGLERACWLAKSRPAPIVSRISKGFDTFLAFAAALQQITGDEDIFLPCRAVGEVLGVDKNTASLYIRLAQQKGWLRKTAASSRTRAARFRFCPPKTHTDGTEGTEGTERKHLQSSALMRGSEHTNPSSTEGFENVTNNKSSSTASGFSSSAPRKRPAQRNAGDPAVS